MATTDTLPIYRDSYDLLLSLFQVTKQLFANVYLNDLDYFAMKLVPGLCYGRYVDDMVFVHRDKGELEIIIKKVEKYLLEKLDLNIHLNKINLKSYESGVDFLGARLLRGRILPQKRTVVNFKKSIGRWEKQAASSSLNKEELAALVASYNSYLGFLARFSTYRLRRKLLRQGEYFVKYGVRMCDKYKKVRSSL